MQIFVINLDHKPMRWRRMADLLEGLPFKRIAAIDGKMIDGPERTDRSLPRSPAKLSRYARACALSHCAAWREFLAGTDRYCCVLEDDLFISPDFPKFVTDETWIPRDCDVVKIETTSADVWFTGKNIACLDRKGALLSSVHLGTAAYILSRRGAQTLLDMAVVLDRAVDRIVFDVDGLQKLHPVYQLNPALCIQAQHRKDGMIFPEMASSIHQVKIASAAPKPRKTLPARAKQELTRLYRQSKKLIKNTGWRLKGHRRSVVPFA